ncbi:MAG: hypothetical protein M0C28_23215 [Candidatus Moduliflexus flocculans]|nr:hypothetical protein [Candidatus Moduliflexus flocculans]
MRRLTALAVAAGGRVAGGAAAARASEGVAIQNKGSDTMVNVAQAWAEAYRKVAPDVERRGLRRRLGRRASPRSIKGTVDIANASRDIKPQEVEQVAAEHGQGADGLHGRLRRAGRSTSTRTTRSTRSRSSSSPSIYARGRHADAAGPSSACTMPGCQSDEIVRVSRQSSSGTYEFFRERVLGKTGLQARARAT